MNDNLIEIKLMFIGCYTALAVFFNYIGLDKEIISLYGLLLGIDYVTGLLKAYRLKQHIKSNIMKYGILSKLVLLLIPITLLITSKIVGIDFNEMVKISLNILAISELYSIIGNLYSVRTAKELPEYDVLALLGGKIKDFLMKADLNEANKKE